MSFSTLRNFERPLLRVQQDIRTLKQKCNAAMIAIYVLLKFGEVGKMSVVPPPLKLHGVNVLNRQQLSRGLFDFAQILYRA